MLTAYKRGGCEVEGGVVEDGDVELPPMLLGGGGLLGTVDGVVPVVLPGTQGVATVCEVPLGRDGEADATVEFELPVLLLVLVEGVLLVEVDGVLPVAVLPLLDGVQGATVAPPCVVLGAVPVTVPALPVGVPVVAVPGVVD